jgi:hypothetical protein
MNRDTLDDYAVCEILINDAIEEMELGREPMDDSHEPWGGLFKPKSRTPHYNLGQIVETDPDKTN